MKKIYQSLIREYAEDVAGSVSAKSVIELKRHRATLSDEGAGLLNVWEEICFQMQRGRSRVIKKGYQAAMRDAVLGALLSLESRDLAALWLQSAEGRYWGFK